MPAVESAPRIAYFCMEYAVEPRLTLYAGGLGVLAGDVLRAARDARYPISAIGLLWDEGYTQQVIDAAGGPRDAFAPTPRTSLEELDAEIAVDVRDETVALRAWRVRGMPLYLLEPRAIRHRWITRRLYGGGAEDRVAQEIVLGIGGVRLLRALGLATDVYHFNEGHAVFAGHELIREATQRGLGFEDAWREVRSRVVFTTHTPVVAGNEHHDTALLRRMRATLELSDEQLARIGGSPYSMTAAGLRLARAANAVSHRHAETARAMWRDVTHAAPIHAITNGVHLTTWQDPRIRAATAPQRSAEDRRSAIRAAHLASKRELVAAVRARAGVELSEEVLLIGFARRATAYKRADLILDPRVEPLLADRKLQLVFAGKAHPQDAVGKQLLQTIVRYAKRHPRAVAFLEGYGMELGALLTRGADVWLNTPRPPMEACGTSGMKAAMNGVLNLSVPDGWWPEGCHHGVNGWQIGRGQPGDDAGDREALFALLKESVIPRYYGDRRAWTDMMLASVDMAAWQFSAARMLEDYDRVLYR